MTDQIATIEGGNEIAKLDNFSNVSEMLEWAKVVLDSGLLPHSITEPEQVLTIVQHGKELGLSPHIALNNINVISGRPTLSATIIGSLLKRRGVEWTWDEDFAVVKGDDGKAEKAPDGSANRRTTIHFYWKSDITGRVMDTTFSVTWAQFVIGELTTKSNWLKLPKNMLRSRCMSEGIRALWPEVFSGFYTTLEINDALGDDTMDVKLNEDGEITIIENNN